MKTLTFIVVLISFFSANKSLEINQKLIFNFANHRNLNYGIIFYCESFNVTNAWTENEETKFIYFAFYDISSVEFNLSETSTIMRFNYRQIGIIFDITCYETVDVFYIFSRFHYFNGSYNWLMLTNNYTNSIEVLQVQNINLDAEITLVVYDEKGFTAKLYDIYNPSSTANGRKMVIQPKGSWNEHDGMVISLKGSKFDQRSNLHGLLIHAGVVASGVGKHQTLTQYMESECTNISSSN